tara:strand:+ start:3759 stop:4181 length:423 start_codon:yes stop_codon:yes gene_type:complete
MTDNTDLTQATPLTPKEKFHISGDPGATVPVHSREGLGKSLDELPLYEIVQEIEQKWDPFKYHMVIDAVLLAEDDQEAYELSQISDNQLLQDKIPEGPGGGIGWRCEFGGTEEQPKHIRFFDSIAAAKYWFLEELTEADG